MKDYADLQPYQQRVVDESNEVNQRAKKLTEFLILPNDVDFEENLRMFKQLGAMEVYCDVLRDRIEAF